MKRFEEYAAEFVETIGGYWGPKNYVCLAGAGNGFQCGYHSWRSRCANSQNRGCRLTDFQAAVIVILIFAAAIAINIVML